MDFEAVARGEVILEEDMDNLQSDLEYLERTTGTGVPLATLNIASVTTYNIPSGYDEIVLIFDGCKYAGNMGAMGLRLNNDSGAGRHQSLIQGVSGNSSSSTTFFVLGDVGAASNSYVDGVVHIRTALKADSIIVAFGDIVAHATGTSNYGFKEGIYTSASAVLGRIDILGTSMTGTVRIYGRKFT